MTLLDLALNMSATRSQREVLEGVRQFVGGETKPGTVDLTATPRKIALLPKSCCRTCWAHWADDGSN